MDLTQLTWSAFVVRNLVPVTLGNMVGGGLLVGLVYWSVYIREFSFRSLGRLAGIAFRLVFFMHPRSLSPRRIADKFSAFRAAAPRGKRSRPVPRDLTTLVDDEEKKDGK